MLTLPERNVQSDRLDHWKRWKLLHQRLQFFWKRWSTEYLNQLQIRNRWHSQSDNLVVNSMVVIKDNAVPPLLRRMGRIIELQPGPDGVVRVVKVRTKLGVLTRPVVKLVPLPSDQN